MLTSVPADFFIIVSIGLVIGLIVLLVLQIITSMRVQRLTYPLYEYAESKAHAEVEKILAEAREQAKQLIADTQTSAAALIESQRKDIESRAREYQSALTALSEAARQSLSESAEKARAEESVVAQTATKEISAQVESIRSNLAHLEKEITGVFELANARSQEILRSLDTQNKQIGTDLSRTFEEIASSGRAHMEEQINAFSKQAEAEVSAYRDSRKKMIDAHMAEMVSETTKLVLQKALTREEHAQLIERALKEAHTLGIF